MYSGCLLIVVVVNCCCLTEISPFSKRGRKVARKRRLRTLSAHECRIWMKRNGELSESIFQQELKQLQYCYFSTQKSIKGSKKDWLLISSTENAFNLARRPAISIEKTWFKCEARLRDSRMNRLQICLQVQCPFRNCSQLDRLKDPRMHNYKG